MKTERIEFVAPSGLKARLHQEAALAKISVGELIRQKFEVSEEEEELQKLTATLRKETADVRHQLTEALSKVDALVSELKSRREVAEKKAA